MKRHHYYVKPHWFDYFSLIVMLVCAVSLVLFLLNINICFYAMPVFVIYISVASCEHTKQRYEMSKKTTKADVVGEIFTEKCQ